MLLPFNWILFGISVVEFAIRSPVSSLFTSFVPGGQEIGGATFEKIFSEQLSNTID